MAKINRLRKNWEFQEIINKKQQIVSKHLVLYFQKANKLAIGISIPKKNSNAVKRNYYKRQLKSVLNLIDLSNIEFKLIIIVRKSFLSLSFLEKKKEIAQILERMRSG